MKRRIVSSLVAAMAMGVMAETVNTVTVTEFNQSYPYAGKATVEYTVGGTLPANAVAEITINTDDASATFTQNNVVAGANTNVIDFASSFGGALVLTNASFTVRINPGDNNLGAPWRMPTDAEHDDLINNCDQRWTAKNGVNGYEFRGRGDYASNSIFLPCAGAGYGTLLDSAGSYCYYWSSVPNSGYSSWGIASNDDNVEYYFRYYGFSVRPVRDAE